MGGLPEYYPIVLDMVLRKKIDIAPFVETRPMIKLHPSMTKCTKQVLLQRGLC